MMRACLLLCLMMAVPAVAQVTKTTVPLSFPNCTGTTPATYDVDVYRPSGAGPFALVGVAHGFQNSKANHEVLARALADKGVVVVVPQFPLLLALQCGSSDHSRNADILWAAMEQERGVSTIDPSRVGLAGHSAGGLSAFLAASRHTVQAVALLDAVDNNGLGAAQTMNVTAPALFLAAESSTCNTQNNSLPWFTSLTGMKGKLRVVGASHCEPQDPLSSTCTAGCGNATTQARQDLFKKYALAFLDRFLNGVTSPCLQTLADADATAGVVGEVDFQFGACGAADDAGTPSPDAGQVGDAGVEPPDAGEAADAGVEPLDAGTEADGGNAVADAGDTSDAGLETNDAGSLPEAGVDDADAGIGPGATPPAGCGCGATGAWASLLAVLLLVLRSRVTRRHDA